jgi:aspartyl protease family protein
MSRIVFIFIALMTVSLLGANVLNDTVVMPAKDGKSAAKLASAKPRDLSNVVITAENGHFATDGRVDGRPIAFIVDTGASQITLRESEAARLGYRPRERDYVVRLRTANGEGRAAPITLRMVEIRNIVVQDVPALVVSDEALNVNLLGMSFLSRIRWTHESGQLVLEQ